MICCFKTTPAPYDLLLDSGYERTADYPLDAGSSFSHCIRLGGPDAVHLFSLHHQSEVQTSSSASSVPHGCSQAAAFQACTIILGVCKFPTRSAEQRPIPGHDSGNPTVFGSLNRVPLVIRPGSDSEISRRQQHATWCRVSGYSQVAGARCTAAGNRVTTATSRANTAAHSDEAGARPGAYLSSRKARQARRQRRRQPRHRPAAPGCPAAPPPAAPLPPPAAGPPPRPGCSPLPPAPTNQGSICTSRPGPEL